MIVGADMLKDMDKWHNSDVLLSMVRLIVINRPVEFEAKKVASAFEDALYIDVEALDIASADIREMLARGCSVAAVEKDPVLAERLAASLGNPTNLTVMAGDALDLIHDSSFAARHFTHMISNLPYQAGTRILLELVQAREIPSMTVLVQTEVAERLAAKEGSKTRGLAGVWAQLDYDVKIVRKVAASCFWPRPEIGSSVVTLTRHERNVALSERERDVFRRLTKKAFEHRRKQLGSVFKDLIQSQLRAEQLSNEDWINLSKGIAENEDS